jgi:hypothetical protein
MPVQRCVIPALCCRLRVALNLRPAELETSGSGLLFRLLASDFLSEASKIDDLGHRYSSPDILCIDT